MTDGVWDSCPSHNQERRVNFNMSDEEYLYTLIITAKLSRAVSASVGPRVNTVVSLEWCLYSVQDTMDVKARIQLDTLRAIKEEPKNTDYQFETN